MFIPAHSVVKVFFVGPEIRAIFWNGERFETVTCEVTPRVNASHEIFAAWEAWLCGNLFRMQEVERDNAWLRYETDRRTIKHGRLVRVVKGRKVRKGTQGTLFYMKETIYGVNCGLRTSDRKDGRGRWQDVVWVDLKNLCVVNPKTGRLLLPLHQS